MTDDRSPTAGRPESIFLTQPASRSAVARTLVGGLLVLKIGLLASWLAEDDAHAWGDQVHYHAMSRSYARVLAHWDLSTPFQLLEVPGVHPPALPLTGALLAHALDGGFAAERQILLIFLALFIVYGYLLAELSIGPWPALLAMIALCGSGGIAMFEHSYMLELPLAVAILAASYHLLRSRMFESSAHSLLLGSWVAFALNVKEIAPIYGLGVGAAMGWAAISNWDHLRLESRLRLRGVALCATVAIGLGTPWILLHLAEVQRRIDEAAGMLDAWTWTEGAVENLLFYPHRAMTHVLGTALSLFAIAGIAFGFRVRPRGFGFHLVAFAGAWICLIWLPKDVTGRYLLPALPFGVFAASAACTALRPLARSLLISLIAVLGAWNYAQVAWRFHAEPPTLQLGSVRLRPLSQWNAEPKDARYQLAIAERLAESGRDREAGAWLSLVRSTHTVSRFSLNSLLEDLGASARVRTPPLYFPPGHASHEHASAGQWIGLRGALLQSGWMLPDGRTRRLSDGYHYYREFANHLFDAAFAADSAFERREWVSEDGRVAMLLERTRDWRDPEIEDAHRFLIGIDPDDLRHYQDFADFWIQRAAGSARARAWQRITRAVGLLGQGDRPAADRAARRALAADPSEPVARWLSVELADPPPSASALIQSIDGCEFWPPLWFEVAARLSEIDQRDAACRVFAQLVRTDRLAVPRPEQLARVTRAAEPCPESEILALRRKRRGHAHRAAAAREGAIYLEWGRAIFAFESYREAALADVRDEQSLEAVDRALAQIPAQRASEFERQREILELELSALRNAGVWSWGVAH